MATYKILRGVMLFSAMLTETARGETEVIRSE